MAVYVLDVVVQVLPDSVPPLGQVEVVVAAAAAVDVEDVVQVVPESVPPLGHEYAVLDVAA